MPKTYGPGFKNSVSSSGQYRARVAGVIGNCFGGVFHHKQATSLAMLTYAVVCANKLGVAALGQALALANGTKQKHGTKQVDRFLSNEKMNLRRLFEPYVRMLIGPAGWIPITIDWTDFDGDNHTTICVSLLTGSKRGLPLIWLSVDKADLKDMPMLVVKPVHTRLHSESSRVSSLGRVMPSLEVVSFHTGSGVPLWMVTCSGRTPLVSAVPDLLNRIPSITVDSVGGVGQQWRFALPVAATGCLI